MARYNANNSHGFEFLGNNELQNAILNEQNFKDAALRKKYMTFGKLLDQTETIKNGGYIRLPIYKKLGILIIDEVCNKLSYYLEQEKKNGQIYFKLFVSYYLGLNLVSDNRKIEHAMGRFNSELQLALTKENADKIKSDFIFSGSNNNSPRHISPFANIREESLAIKFLSVFKRNSKIVIKDSIVELFIILIIKSWCMDYKTNRKFKASRFEACIVGEVFRQVHGFDAQVVKKLIDDLNSERMIDELNELPDDEDLDLQLRIRELKKELGDLSGNPRGIKSKKGTKKKGTKRKTQRRKEQRRKSQRRKEK